MKRIVPALLLSALVVVGCGRNKQEAEKGPELQPAELTPPPAPAPAPTYTAAPEPAPITSPAPTVKPAPLTGTSTAPKTTVAPKPAAKPAPVASKTYTVKKGDTLSEIAAAHKTTVKKILELNPKIKSADSIVVGQKLNLP